MVLITGAGSGVGRALARVLAQEGYGIAAVDVREDGLRALAAEVHPKIVVWRIADVTDPVALQNAVCELETEAGPIDVLVANAGIGIETTAVNYSASDMAKVLNVNLVGVSNSIAAVLAGMIERKRGHLVAISSIASYRGLPRMIAYSASKAGVNAIMDGLRVELIPLGIHVSTVCPGWIRTPLTQDIGGDLAFILEVEEAAREIAYAIRKKLVFYTFPRPIRWRMRLLTMLPRSWQDWYITRLMNRISTKRFGDAKEPTKPAG